jgi:hypothetical protein
LALKQERKGKLRTVEIDKKCQKQYQEKLTFIKEKNQQYEEECQTRFKRLKRIIYRNKRIINKKWWLDGKWSKLRDKQLKSLIAYRDFEQCHPIDKEKINIPLPDYDHASNESELNLINEEIIRPKINLKLDHTKMKMNIS